MATPNVSVWSQNLAKLPGLSFENVENIIKIKSKTPIASDQRGFTLFDGGYVYKYEVQYGEHTVIRGMCFRSQSKSADPHKVKVSLSSTPIQLEDWHCSCKAGKGFCQHAIALLYQTAQYKKKGCKVVPPAVSKTSTPQAWGIPKRSEGFSARPLHDVELHKVKKQKTTTEKKKKRKAYDGVRSTVYNPVLTPLMELNIKGKLHPLLQASRPRPQLLDLFDSETTVYEQSRFGLVPFGCALASQHPERDVQAAEVPKFNLNELPLHGNGGLDNDEKLFFDGMKLPKDECEGIENMTRNQSNCTKWHDIRKNRLTASIAHRITARRGNFPSLAKQLMKPTRQTAAMKEGLEKEPQAAENYTEEIGLTTYPVGFVINPSAPHMGCSPDRRVYDQNEDSPWGILEIKCPQAASYTDLSYLKVNEKGMLKLKVRHEYYTQVMVQLGITGSEWCDFFALCQNDYHWERIYFSETKFQEMKEKIDLFFFNYYLPHIMHL